MIIDCALYEGGHRRTGTLPLDDVPDPSELDRGFVWIGLHEPSMDEFEAVRREFGLHELAIEDAVRAHQRPKLEEYGETLFLVLKTARYIDETESVDFGEILLFVGEKFVVAVRHGQASELASVRKKIEARPDLMEMGPSAVVHAILDHVVDGYAPVLRGVEDDIQEVELEVFSENQHNPVERIYRLKREVLEVQRAIAPLLEPLDDLEARELDLIHEGMREYFRDVHDHVLRDIEQVSTFNDLLTSVLEANLTRVSVRQNNDMRKISSWVAIAAVPTMVAGIYGMNFEHMPELEWRFGYPLIVGLMVLACSLMYRAFRRSGWL